MDQDIKFIQVTTSSGKQYVLNTNQIVGVKKTGRGCLIKTTNSDLTLALTTTFEELISMLPSVVKIEEINQ